MDRPPLTPTEFNSAVTAITSAFGDPTRREIYLFAHGRAGGVTASEVAERFDLHPNVARHHLDKLTAGGYLETRVERERSSAGRPSKHYRVVEDHMSLEFPVRHDDLIVTLLGRALALLTPEQAERLAEGVGIEYGVAMATAMGDQMAQKSFRTALHTVADALSAHGFAAHTEKHGGELHIVSENCPFGDAVIQHPVICAVDRGLVKGMLGALYGQETALDLQSSKPRGDDICVTAVES
ncbi:MAG: hypothetical protein JJLCMIEE_01893 [Acidimicrobiales bacterium]|nr:MAG: hypothetical protein EDR02_10520 [Actinomycetota bacterium]MBV6508827.1 hypothetical protein [Acidimicrobiales bacterium]RIK04956.1 MAG: hypothetical protein DCC48_11420 [Acidobacteriota bacterium]